MARENDLAARIVRLERYNLLLAIILAVLLVVVGAGAVSDFAFAEARSIKAGQIVLLDAEGAERAVWETNPDGRPLLTLRDKDGHVGIAMGYSQWGTPGIKVGVFGPHTDIGFDQDGNPVVQLRSGDGTSQVELALNGDAGPNATLFDATGSVLWRAR